MAPERHNNARPLEWLSISGGSEQVTKGLADGSTMIIICQRLSKLEC